MRIARHPRTASRIIDGQAVVINVDQNRLYTLNATASRVWQRLGEGASLDDLAAEICHVFDIDGMTARNDCRRLCDELTTLGLVVCLP